MLTAGGDWRGYSHDDPPCPLPVGEHWPYARSQLALAAEGDAVDADDQRPVALAVGGVADVADTVGPLEGFGGEAVAGLDPAAGSAAAGRSDRDVRPYHAAASWKVQSHDFAAVGRDAPTP